MKNLNIYFLALFLATTLFGCDKDHGPSDTGGCTFVQKDDDMDGYIDDTEKAIMKECDDAALNSIDEIAANLIGEWELIGHAEGWTPIRSQPCGYMTITADDLILDFDSGYRDEITTHEWWLEEVNWARGTYFRLKVKPGGLTELALNHFSERYMYCNYTGDDGNMYLYEKMK